MLVALCLLTSLAFILSLLFTPSVTLLAVRFGLVDQPDGKRKVHKKPIPRVGGIAVALAYFGAYLIVKGVFGHHQLLSFQAIQGIAPAAILIFLVGLADDIFNLQPWHKLSIQILAAILVVSSGVHLGGSSVSRYSAVASIGSVLWIVACTNAVNLIDGLDGLASGVALMATVSILAASLVTGHTELSMITAPFAAALIGFLVFNFNPASIFLGDCGSLTIGFLLGCFGVLWSGDARTWLGILAPIVVLSVPLLDTTLAIARRFLRNQPIFRPDRSHIHHRLLARGLSHRRAVIFLYFAGGMAGAFSLALMCARNGGEVFVLIAFGGAVLFGVHQLGNAEFDAARKVLFRKSIRREIHAELTVQSVEQSLTEALTPHDCWTVIEKASAEFGFEAFRMKLAGQVFGQAPFEARRSTSINVALSDDDWIELMIAEAGNDERSSALLPFAATIQRAITAKALRPVTHKSEEGRFQAIYAGHLAPPVIN